MGAIRVQQNGMRVLSKPSTQRPIFFGDRTTSKGYKQLFMFSEQIVAWQVEATNNLNASYILKNFTLSDMQAVMRRNTNENYTNINLMEYINDLESMRQAFND